MLVNWCRDYNEHRPHSSLNYMTPSEFAAKSSGGKNTGSSCLDNAGGVRHSPALQLQPAKCHLYSADGRRPLPARLFGSPLILREKRR